MDKISKLEKLNRLLELSQNDTMTPKDVDKFLRFLFTIIKGYKTEFKELSDSNIALIKKTLNHIISQNSNLLTDIDNKNKSVRSDVDKKVKELISYVDKMSKRLPKDGKDADEEKIVKDVLTKLPKQIIETPEELRDKLSSLKGGDRLDASAIKNLPSFNGTNFGGNTARYLSQLNDVVITSIANNDVLKWNSTTLRWENGAVAGGAGTVDSVNGATGVVVLDTGDIADTLNARYVTDAYLTVLSNTSGTNSGDNAVNTLYSGLVSNATHTGDVTGSTVLTIAAGAVDITMLSATGTPDGTTYLRGDNTWATIAGGGDVSKVGTPVANRVAYWTGDGTLGHEAGFTYDPTTDTLTAVSFVGALTGNVTGNVSGSSGSTTGNAATVTTNANLTGHITSVGNAAVLGSFTKAQLDTAVSDGNVMYIGDAPTAHTHALAAGATDVTSSAAELNILDGATLSTAELNYVDGVTSAIQTQLDAKLALAGGTMSGNITLGENTAIVLDPAGSADGKYTGITVTGVAGYAQAFGDLVYLSSVDSRWELADADAASTADRMMAMVVVAGGSDGAACTLLLQGIIRADAKFPALTIGSAVYVGETAGAIQVAIPTGADNVIRRVGYAMTADEIYFSPSQDSQITVA